MYTYLFISKVTLFKAVLVDLKGEVLDIGSYIIFYDYGLRDREPFHTIDYNYFVV